MSFKEVAIISPRLEKVLTRCGSATDGGGILCRLEGEISNRAREIWQTTGETNPEKNWLDAERTLLRRVLFAEPVEKVSTSLQTSFQLEPAVSTSLQTSFQADRPDMLNASLILTEELDEMREQLGVKDIKIDEMRSLLAEHERRITELTLLVIQQAAGDGASRQRSIVEESRRDVANDSLDFSSLTDISFQEVAEKRQVEAAAVARCEASVQTDEACESEASLSPSKAEAKKKMRPVSTSSLKMEPSELELMWQKFLHKESKRVANNDKMAQEAKRRHKSLPMGMPELPFENVKALLRAGPLIKHLNGKLGDQKEESVRSTVHHSHTQVREVREALNENIIRGWESANPRVFARYGA
mmetsp:Transcript_22680/g.52939  ORF Transcript_22680/g.52939 Transcript_22680/m.52939 type:complete len:358 (+) Transcript_22680:120-1193(+)